MKRKFRIPVFGFLLIIIASIAFADVPRLIKFEAIATNSRGRPINGRRTLTFSIYDTPSNGSPLWSETHTDVSLSRGAFSVLLGSSTPLTPAFDTNYWVGIQVNSEAELPRVPLPSAPYALRAAVAEGLSSNAVATLVSNVIALLPTAAQFPSGAIVMWSGAIVPTGWAFCDGTSGTPDLRNRFVVSIGSSFGMHATGGTTNHVHTGSATPTGPIIRLDDNSGGTDYDLYHPSYPYNFTSDPTNHLPPFYALAFIMKL